MDRVCLHWSDMLIGFPWEDVGDYGVVHLACSEVSYVPIRGRWWLDVFLVHTVLSCTRLITGHTKPRPGPHLLLPEAFSGLVPMQWAILVSLWSVTWNPWLRRSRCLPVVPAAQCKDCKTYPTKQPQILCGPPGKWPGQQDEARGQGWASQGLAEGREGSEYRRLQRKTEVLTLETNAKCQFQAPEAGEGPTSKEESLELCRNVISERAEGMKERCQNSNYLWMRSGPFLPARRCMLNGKVKDANGVKEGVADLWF